MDLVNKIKRNQEEKIKNETNLEAKRLRQETLDYGLQKALKKGDLSYLKRLDFDVASDAKNIAKNEPNNPFYKNLR